MLPKIIATLSFGLATALGTLSESSFAADDQKCILVVIGPSNHPPGSHEVAAGGRLLKYCLETMTNASAVQVELVEYWPNQKQRDAASTIVFLGDTFPANRFRDPKQNLKDLSAMMARGCGIVCLHYATGLLGVDVSEEGDHPLLDWMGGYFANRSCPHHESIARIYPRAKIERSAPEHPISRGWKSFEINDEPYIKNYFGRQQNRLGKHVIPIATSMLPPEHPKKETVAWCLQREDGGRGFAVVMPHFYKNWKDDSLRRLILNATLWTAQIEVPQLGVETALENLEQFEPESVTPR